ncbi:hypothetical protein PtrSN002B_003238 [Pyrenophora tritici-repentis]|uniref:Uncharacterized protein n=1 Tax=Pyrenophora tritici-repentis TaxID=45151 RepID=A0A2W1EDK6_9PLEO|nr:hypothetical protein PtrV1_03996 [Pyrenophora tritici-repentis]KAF7451680.1 hypothetical protein A1F99_034570 [Pyrenophora tritici-repentis]KAF7575206.1 hypothetical protein PtrM4_068300 [Pyrenophora tritici-repentis]KAG9386035.1 hypothetical protein A1F94_002785 [Pyrenophora tritici-repentis]KAI0582930.1 hypothetical protein Alg215_03831 [Pyrenophora tritici-repentis]
MRFRQIHTCARRKAHAMARSSVGASNGGFNRFSDVTEKRKGAGNVADSNTNARL